MTTLVVSDLHLGSRTDVDVLREADARARLVAAIAEWRPRRLVLLGDTLELRHGPVPAVLEAAAPVFAAIADALPRGAEVVLVPGNHDHALLAGWHERRALASAPPLGLEQTAHATRDEALAQVAELLRPARLTIRYPGLWLREDVYATHGHYLDRHFTVPTFERLAAGLMLRVTGAVPEEGATPEHYEAGLAPIYAWLHAVARHTTSRVGVERQRGSQNAWKVLTATGRRPLRQRALKAGFPVAVAALNRARLGPVRADVTAVELRRAGVRAMHTVVDRLAIDARWILFGHTHRPGPLPHDDRGEWGRLVNTGSWVHEETFLGDDPRDSPYFPGTIVVVADAPGSEPVLLNALR